MAKKVLLLIGAGASRDAGGPDPDQRVFNERWRPPLVNDIFENTFEFGTVLQRYPGARALAGFIRGLIRAGRPFEEILRSLRDSKNPTLSARFLEVPLYLSDLFNQVTNNFSGVGVTEYNTLVAFLEEAAVHEALFATTNYDRVLDKALSDWYRRDLSRVLDYLDLARGRSCAKLHGCCYWWRRVVGFEQKMSLLDYIAYCGKIQLEDEILVRRHEEVSTSPPYLYPALSAPVAGKSEFVCPQHELHFRNFAAEATHLLILGFSCRDDHIVDALVSARRLKKLLIVNGSAGPTPGQPSWGEAALRILVAAAPHLDGQLDHAPGDGIFEGGFRDALDSGVILNFLSN